MAKEFDPTKGGTKVPASSSFGALFSWIGTRGDYSSIERKDKALTGWRRKVNPNTTEGKAFVVIATWVTTAALGVYIWRNRKGLKKQKEDT